MMTNHYLYRLAFLLILTMVACTQQDTQERPPNIVIIYLDDLGYGDVSAYGSTQLKTPNMDELANNGLRFTNGYASSAACTPSRYSLLTGLYPWRERRARILPGTAPLIIDTAQITIPKMLREQGYHTGIVGKWHLGLGTGEVDWNQRVSPGPNEVGFDYSYIMAATQDRVPTVYLENGHVTNLDPSDPIAISYQENFPGQRTGLENREQLKMNWEHGHNNSVINGIPRIGFMKGGKTAEWIDEDMADEFLIKSQEYIKTHKNEPFFLYYALQQPHVPRTPHPRFIGSTSLGPRGDVIVEADWCIGQLMNTLEEEGLLENTLIVFSSDNGPVLNDGYYDDAVEKNGAHTPWGPLRGGKYSLYEAGSRVPFMTYWKGKIEAGVSNAMVSQLDLFSSIASIVGSEKRTKDSHDLSNLLLGKDQSGREELVLQATGRTAFRKNEWAMIPPHDGSPLFQRVNIESGNDTTYQLYNLTKDLGEKNNLAEVETDLLQELVAEYESIRYDERSGEK